MKLSRVWLASALLPHLLMANEEKTPVLSNVPRVRWMAVPLLMGAEAGARAWQSQRQTHKHTFVNVPVGRENIAVTFNVVGWQ